MIMIKQFGKIAALCAVVAMTVVLLGQGANAGTLDIMWQKQTTGKAAFWILNSNGKLKNKTENDGWDWVDADSIGTAWRAEKVWDAPTSKRYMLYHNVNNGKVAFWLLNSNGNLQNRTQGEGWDYVSDQTMNTGWSMTAIMPSTSIPANSNNNSMDRLLWFRAANGKVAYWNLNSNGKLQNRTQGQGWGYVDDEQTLTNWRFAQTMDHK